MKRIAWYCRIGNKETDTQLQQLTEYSNKQGYNVVSKYIDKGVSGATLNRPQLQELLKDAELNKFDTVLFTSFDRLK